MPCIFNETISAKNAINQKKKKENKEKRKREERLLINNRYYAFSREALSVICGQLNLRLADVYAWSAHWLHRSLTVENKIVCIGQMLPSSTLSIPNAFKIYPG